MKKVTIQEYVISVALYPQERAKQVNKTAAFQCNNTNSTNFHLEWRLQNLQSTIYNLWQKLHQFMTATMLVGQCNRLNYI